jgi:hypothetical protein
LPENFNVGEIDINTIVLNDLIFAKQFPIRIYCYDGIPDIVVPKIKKTNLLNNKMLKMKRGFLVLYYLV